MKQDFFWLTDCQVAYLFLLSIPTMVLPFIFLYQNQTIKGYLPRKANRAKRILNNKQYFDEITNRIKTV